MPPLFIKTPPLFTKTPHFFLLKINHYKKNILCDSNVYKCLPTIHFCLNILFLFYYIWIKLFIKVINLINDDCIKFICFINYYNNYMCICLYLCRRSLMSLITGKKVKTHTSQGIVKNKGTKPTKEWLDVAIWLNI